MLRVVEHAQTKKYYCTTINDVDKTKIRQSAFSYDCTVFKPSIFYAFDDRIGPDLAGSAQEAVGTTAV